MILRKAGQRQDEFFTSVERFGDNYKTDMCKEIQTILDIMGNER